ncbi:hypothetical protein [Desulfonema magnum]|uniref:Uncharacterized protein n=1 Tax=Desulfonema magnum TaxID=45655 RepID=A0A975BWN6_9BACT|nr:hypothetical protein [Desulfonema magnum]QTA92687.1 Uncharacterized protein dnm_087750 [Desulfonema magnum]QTA92688.1 Uncharacterized protein dnm_087760 [Desulfonema magnum]
MKQKELSRKKMKAVKGGWTDFAMVLGVNYASTDTGRRRRGGLDFKIAGLCVKIR